MPFPRPTLTALRTQAMQDIASSGLPNADGFLRRAALNVLAWVQAGLAFLHYGYLDWIAQNATPFYATAEFLDAWAALAPTPVIRLAPQQATCPTVQFTGTSGADLANGTLMLRSDGFQYQTTADAVVIGSTVTAPIIAVLAGSIGNAYSGISLTLANPGSAPGINSGSGVATAAIQGGTDLELDPALRARMLESYAAPPSGGDQADYVTWALQVAGITRAWTSPNAMGAGTVVVYFMMDVVQAAYNGFPQGTNGVAAAEPRATAATGNQLALANWIYPKQPVTALVYAQAPTAQPQNVTIAGLTSSTTQQKAAISAALAALMVTKGNPLATVGIYQSDFDAAIGAVAGLPAFSVTVPSSWPITPAVGSLITLGTVTYV